MSTINWEQTGTEFTTPEFDNGNTLKPVYEALMVLKQDFDEALREKQVSETQQRELEEKLHHAEKIQAIGQLAGGVAHDFNNQLASIMVCTELLMQNASDSNAVVKYADTILQTSRRAASLTAQLLAFARKGKYLSVDVNMHTLIDEVVAMLDHSIDKRIIMQKDLAARRFIITGDPGQLQNALLNIALNARDAMHQGGTLSFSTVTVTLSADDCVHQANDLGPGAYIQMQISDTGHGMTAEVQKHLFEPFFNTKEPGKGTGMGLASVYGSVKLHKGAIKVRTEEEHGTTIELLFPCAESETAHCTGIWTAEEKECAPRPCRIMVVEDDPRLREIVSDMLSCEGHVVSAEINGKEAVDRYLTTWREIDLVVLDLIMPVMSGPETFVELRKINPAARILISSGYGIDGEAERLIAAGARGFIKKPFSTSEMSTAIMKAIS